jgi:hypothetical protein
MSAARICQPQRNGLTMLISALKYLHHALDVQLTNYIEDSSDSESRKMFRGSKITQGKDPEHSLEFLSLLLPCSQGNAMTRIPSLHCMRPFASLQTLQDNVAPNEKRQQPRFSVRLLRTLNFTLANPLFRAMTGAFWSTDGRTFWMNSRLFTEFLRLKPNSINANFRDHDFTRRNHPADLGQDLASLPDRRNWK